MILEDTHWLEDGDRRILEFVLENCVTDTPIVFLLVYRPEREDGTTVEFSFSPAYVVADHIDLAEVDERASTELAGRLLESLGGTGAAGISPGACRFILDRSGGNPFYLEELVYDLVERGQLVEHGNEWVFKNHREDASVPGSLTGLILSRLERLPESWRSVLQNSSVLGMEFQLKLYWKLVNKLFLGMCHPDVFDGLEDRKLLFSEMNAYEKMYFFRHILVHNTAYSSILESNLRKLHRAAAEAIEEMFPSERERVSGILMHHYDRAGAQNRAIEWGFKALEHYGGEEALKLSYRLEDLLEEYRDGEDPEERVFRLLSSRDKALDLLSRREEQRLVIERMMNIASRSDSAYWMAIALKKRGALARVTGRMDEARSCWEKSLDLTRKAGEYAFEGIVLGNLGALDLNQGRFDDAKIHFEKALKIHRDVGDLRSEGIILMNLGIAHKNLGLPDEARSCYENALETARRVGDRRTVGDVLGNIGTLLWYSGNLDEACEYYQQSLAKQQEIGNRRSAGITMSNLAILRMNQGRMEEALEGHEKALETMRETGDLFMEGNILGNLGVMHMERGELKKAKTLYKRALKIHRVTGNRSHEGITLGNLGNIHFKQGSVDKARALYSKALQALQEVKNRAEEGNVLSNQGCLFFEEGQIDQAQDCHRKALAIIRDLKLEKCALPGFADLHGKLLSVGRSPQWPAHWKPS